MPPARGCSLDKHRGIEDLVAAVLAELHRLRYTARTKDDYRQFYWHVMAYAHSRGIAEYSEQFASQFFEETFHVAIPAIRPPIPPKLNKALRYLRSLGDFQLHGTVLRARPRKAARELPDPFRGVIESFVRDCEQRGHSPHTIADRQRWLHAFADYLAGHGVSPNTIAADHISRYTATLVGHHAHSVATILSPVRTFLKFLYLEGYHTQDLSASVPRIRWSYHTRIPTVWPRDAVERLLRAVDRGNPTGKRDYAILLLAARLGMRIGDIKALTLSALQWDKNTISWVQQKTRRPISYPLLDDVGWALIDYLQNGRPPTASPHVFVRHRAPFEPYGHDTKLGYLIATYARRAGIPVPRERHGMHSLRHTLASRLLEQHTPLPVIAEILGHLSTQSTRVYLHVDLDALRQCALDPEEVFAGVDHI